MKTKTEIENRSWIQFKKLLALQAVVLLASVPIQTRSAPSDVDLTFDARSAFPLPINFGSWLPEFVETIRVQRDGKVLIGGIFNGTNNTDLVGIKRLSLDGSLDSSFLCSSIAGVEDIAIQPDDKILVGQHLCILAGKPTEGNIFRLNPDGSNDALFRNGLAGTAGGCGVTVLALQNDGKVIIGGDFRSVNGIARTNLARLNPDGSLDTSFATRLGPPNGTLRVNSIVVQSDGRILLGGYFFSVNGVARTRLARINADGTLDASFNPVLNVAYDYGVDLALQTDGKIAIWSNLLSVNGVPTGPLARLNADGSLDNSFAYQTSPFPPDTVALQDDGKFLVPGLPWSEISTNRNISRLSADGLIDNSFGVVLQGTGFQPTVRSLVVLPDGRILIGGGFTSVNGVVRTNIVRLMGQYVPLAIQTLPRSQTIETASTARFVVSATGYPAPHYQWFFNGTNGLNNWTNSSLLLSNVQSAQSGSYTVVVTNITGAVTSSPAMLNVIAAVERRPVPGVKLTGQPGSLLNLDYANTLTPALSWTTLGSVSLTSTSQFYFDLTTPLPSQRFYRAWQTGTPSVVPSLGLNFVPAITLTGNVGDSLRLDYINAIGPTDAWVTLDTVTLTNTSQLYFDVSAPGQPTRLYRIVLVP